jgi:hypothetical protein
MEQGKRKTLRVLRWQISAMQLGVSFVSFGMAGTCGRVACRRLMVLGL